MSFVNLSGQLAYIAIFLAAAIEGEVVLVTASVLVALGRLHPLGVFLAAALGGSAGDQFFFYVLRGRLRAWLIRFPSLARREKQFVQRVQERSIPLIVGSRFLPGLRIAIPAACACAGVPALQFTTLNFIGSLAWAGFILALVSWLGPASLEHLGMNSWWVPVLPAILVVIFFQWVGRSTKTLEAA
jgi:membrane protein DedA with SNARE-associated domain